MAALCWSVAVAVFMMVTNGLNALDQHQLAPIVQEILNRYTPNGENRNVPMFSVAVSVPYNNNKNMYDMSKVPDSGEDVRKKILNCEVYASEKVVAATVLRWPNVLVHCPNGPVQWTDVRRSCKGKEIKTWADIRDHCGLNEIEDRRADHAEYRTLQHFNTLKKSDTDLMVFYVRASSCEGICTNPNSDRNILKSIKQIQKWKNYAVVFSDVFQRDGENPTEALKKLGDSVGLKNIFRCKTGQEVKCINCNKNGEVIHTCSANVGRKKNRWWER